MRRVVDQADIGGDVGGGPAARHQFFARLSRVGRGADGADDFVDVRHGDGEAAEDVAAFAGLAQLKRRAAGDNFLAEGDEMREEIAQGELFGAATVQRQHVAAEGGLHRGEAVELVQHDIGRGVAFEFDHHAHADPVGFVGDAGNPFDLLVADHFGDLFDHGSLVHLIGNLVHDDGETILSDFFHPRAGANDDAAASFEIGLARAGPAKDHRARGEIGGGDDVHQRLGREVRVFDQRERAVDDFAQVVGRDIGRHADSDAARAIDQHVGEAGGKDGGFAVLAIVIVLEFNGFLVDIGKEEGGGFVHPHFGIAHGRRRVAVHGAEIALPVEQFQRHGEGLRHADQRVIDRRVAVGVVFPHRVAHGAGGFAVGLVVGVAGFLHREKDAAVDRFQPVAQIGDGAAYDHAHGVVEIGGLHLVRDGDLGAVPRVLGRGIFGVFRGFRGIVHVSL